MTRLQAHRGPDDEGTWSQEFPDGTWVGLGSRRLAILDLSPAGRMPMSGALGRLQLVYNGEIYNFKALREELRGLGRSFKSSSDTEVMLEAVAQWGLVEAARRFNGMFAFALWDRSERTLHLVRDRLGEKPLYYGFAGKTFLFASELKAFQALPGWQADFNISAVHDYLTYGYVPGTQTIFRNVWKVPPGSTVIWRRGEVRIERYWDVGEIFKAQDPAGNPPSEAEALSEVRALLAESVRLRLVGDVPLGAFLSGGIDSSAVVACMARASAARVRTFSICFDDAAFDEKVAEAMSAVNRLLRT
jgi:asparagine synthase (glutamine-hydrolysing)